MFLNICFRTLILCFITQSLVWGQNEAVARKDGLLLKLDSSKYVYEPNEIIEIGYSVHNLDHLGIQLSFLNSGRAFFVIEKNGMTSQRLPTVASGPVGYSFIDQNAALQIGLNVSLEKLIVVEGEETTDRFFSFADGDTIQVYGELGTQRFGIGVKEESQFEKLLRWQQIQGAVVGDESYDSEFDFDKDGVLSFNDFANFSNLKYLISEWHDLQSSELVIELYLCVKTADIDRNGSVDLKDFLGFANSYGAHIGNGHYLPRADFDGDGVIEFVDFIHFARRYINREGGQ